MIKINTKKITIKFYCKIYSRQASLDNHHSSSYNQLKWSLLTPAIKYHYFWRCSYVKIPHSKSHFRYLRTDSAGEYEFLYLKYKFFNVQLSLRATSGHFFCPFSYFGSVASYLCVLGHIAWLLWLPDSFSIQWRW